MPDSRVREPNGSANDPQPPPAFSRLKCPNCGREAAIVFPLVRGHHKAVGEVPLVCLNCCQEVRDRG